VFRNTNHCDVQENWMVQKTVRSKEVVIWNSYPDFVFVMAINVA